MSAFYVVPSSQSTLPPQSTKYFPPTSFHWKFSTEYFPPLFNQNVSIKNGPPTKIPKKCPKVQGHIFAQSTWSSLFLFYTYHSMMYRQSLIHFYSIVWIVAASPPPAHKIDATSTIFHSNALWTTRPQLVMMWICKFAPKPSRHRAAHQQKRKKMIHSRHCYNCSNLSVVIQIKAWPLTFVLICTVAGQLKHWSSLYLWFVYCIFLCVLYLYLCTYVMMTMAHAKIICSQKIYGF